MQLLLDKFDSVSVVEEGLSEADLDVCRQAQAEYDQAYEHLMLRKKLLSKLHQEFSSLTKGQRVNKEIPDRANDMRSISDVMSSLQYDLTNTILFHFRDAYSLQIPYPSSLLQNGNIKIGPDYKLIVEQLREYLGGIFEFSDHTRNLIKQNFVKSLWEDSKKAGAKVTLTYRYVVEHCRFTKKTSLLYHSGTMTELKLALSLFETDSVAYDKRFDTLVPRDEFDFSVPILLPPAADGASVQSKVKGLRFYKNSRVDVLFNSVGDAELFCKFFDLKLI
jgi:hypothetical protein